MKKNSFLRRSICLTGSAVLLAGLLTGFSLKTPGALALSADAYSVTAGEHYRVAADTLNIRSGPGYHYTRQGTLHDGTLVEVLEVRGDWARIAPGWIHMDFLRPANHLVQPEPDMYGYVKATTLNVRSGPGTQYAICGQLNEGYRVTILETQDGWGRISDGWISLNYVNRLSSPSGNAAPGYQNIRVNDSVRVAANILNVRQGPGTNYNTIGKLVNGDVVTIREIRGGWGRYNGGWISLDYVRTTDYQKDPGYVSSGGTVEITADRLTVRSGPSVAHQACGMMTKGYRTNVLEVKDGWGRVDNGWISLSYARWIR